MRLRRAAMILAGAVLGAASLAGLALVVRPAPRAQAGTTTAPGAVAAGFSGTATGIGPGLLLTNSHVVRACQRQGWPIRVAGLGGTWELRNEDADADLALLAGPAEAGNAVLAISSAGQLPRGTPVLALGFPAQSGGATLGMASGHVVRAALTIRDPSGQTSASFVMHDRLGREVQPSWEDGLRYYGAERARHLRWVLEVDALVPAGSSGGPLLDSQGHLVGLIFAGDPGRRLTATVPLGDLREFLLKAGVYPRFALRGPAATQDWQSVAQAAATAVYQIRC